MEATLSSTKYWTGESVDFARYLTILTPRASSANRNKFVHYALQYTLKLAAEYSASTFTEVLSHGLEIVAVGDNDFYTQKVMCDARL